MTSSRKEAKKELEEIRKKINLSDIKKKADDSDYPSRNFYKAIGKANPKHYKMYEACVEALTKCKKKLVPENTVGEVFDTHAKIFDDLGYKKSRMNACGYSLGATFSPNWMDTPPMIFADNPLILQSGMVFFMHMILMDSENQLAMNLGETYLVTEKGNERLGKQKLDLIVL